MKTDVITGIPPIRSKGIDFFALAAGALLALPLFGAIAGVIIQFSF